MERIKSKLPDSCLSGFDKDYNTNHFFFEQNCFLKDYMVNGEKINLKAGDYINKQCKAYDINQKLILTTLQREQSLISKKDIKDIVSYKRPDGAVVDSITGACGVGLYDTKTLNRYIGFDNQIKWACATYRTRFNEFKPNTEFETLDKDKDGKYIKVIPESGLVFALLRYTPHLTSVEKTEKVWFDLFNGREFWV